ncbi:MAG: hypothetical protein WCG83_03790 [Candidatus Peregrinibacteria bacterium]
MRTPLRTILTLALSLSLIPAAVASAGQTASGATLAGSGTDVWAERLSRTEGFIAASKNFAPVQAAWPEKWQKYQAKLSAHISKCRDAVRKANRDTVTSVSMQCLRTQYLMEQDFLKREKTLYQGLPGITDPIKAEMTAKNEALSGAFQSLIDGIDAKVLRTTDDLKRVRKNLLSTYRVPYWLSVAHLQADEAQTWTISLLLTSRETAPDNAPCLGAAEALFITSSSATTQETAMDAFTKGSLKILKCTSPAPDSGTGSLRGS